MRGIAHEKQRLVSPPKVFNAIHLAFPNISANPILSGPPLLKAKYRKSPNNEALRILAFAGFAFGDEVGGYF